MYIVCLFRTYSPNESGILGEFHSISKARGTCYWNLGLVLGGDGWRVWGGAFFRIIDRPTRSFMSSGRLMKYHELILSIVNIHLFQ